MSSNDRIRLGGTTVEYLPDSTVTGDPCLAFPGTTAADWAGTPDLDPDGRLTANVGSFLVRRGSFAALVDLGLGPAAVTAPNGEVYAAGRLSDSLAAAGLTPADIDLVVLTHLHWDHVGWVGTDGALTFGAARHVVARAEWHHWRAHPGPGGPDPDRVLAPLAPVVEFPTGPTLAPGLTAVPSPGHTPGHLCVLVTDPGTDDRLLIAGDLLHVRAQLTEPGFRFRGDVDPDRAEATRRDVLARYADGRTTLVSGHFAGSVLAR